MPGRVRVAFVLTELTIGGAEMMLWKLLSRIDRGRFDPWVVALSGRTDRMLELFRSIDVQCEIIGMGRGASAITGFVRFGRVLREIRPDIVQGWLYHGNVAATFAAPLLFAPRPPVLWSIRGTLISGEKRLTRLIIMLSAKLSWLPRAIIYNSRASAVEHEHTLGYRSGKRVIIPNGFDLEVFRPSAEARVTLREGLGLEGHTILIGNMSRYHPMKDHDNFLQAVALVSAKHPHVHYVLAGENVDLQNAALKGMVSRYGMENRVHLLGIRNDMPAVLAALDVVTSSSASGEGFQNVVGEAMSCGVPCVVTDVGDSGWIVDDTGSTVAPRDFGALASALCALIDAGGEVRKALGKRARQRILDCFSLDAVIREYERVFLQVYQDSQQTNRA